MIRSGKRGPGLVFAPEAAYGGPTGSSRLQRRASVVLLQFETGSLFAAGMTVIDILHVAFEHTERPSEILKPERCPKVMTPRQHKKFDALLWKYRYGVGAICWKPSPAAELTIGIL